MGTFSNLTGFRGRDTAVDFGTVNTLVYVRGRGIVLSEPFGVIHRMNRNSHRPCVGAMV